MIKKMLAQQWDALNDVGQQEFQQLPLLVGQPVMSSTRDQWMWALDGVGVLTIRTINKELQRKRYGVSANVFERNSWVPKKVGIVAWRTGLKRFPTRCALLVRSTNVSLQSISDCGEHLFVSCEFDQRIW